MAVPFDKCLKREIFSFSKIERKKIQHTDLSVSSLCVCGVCVCVCVCVLTSCQVAEKLMTIAYESGVNLFDTAEVYAGGRWVPYEPCRSFAVQLFMF